jgi:hypothetical protein
VEWFFGNLKVATIVTLTIGLFVTLYETMESQLRETQWLADERDEAGTTARGRTQLASIESRTQPHFLFNTLNSVRRWCTTPRRGGADDRPARVAAVGARRHGDTARRARSRTADRARIWTSSA